MAKVYEVDPVSRIEGHLGVKVTTNDTTGYVEEANAHGNLWRGFENFLVGRRVNDAITFTQRICGVCPVPHGSAATLAADSVMGISDGYATFDNDGGTKKGIPAAGLLIRNTVLACEFLMSSITHFYHLVAQDYIQGPNMAPWTPYFDTDQYHPLLLSGEHALPFDDGLWSAVIKQYVKALRIRRLTFEAGAMFAGRMPMMSMSIAGGTTNYFRSKSEYQAKLTAFYNLMTEVGMFVVTEYVPLTFALGALYPNYDNLTNATIVYNEANTVIDAAYGVGTDKKHGLWALGNHDTNWVWDADKSDLLNAPAAANAGWGAGLGNFLAWGAFPATGGEGKLYIKGGTKVGTADTIDLLTMRSDLKAAKAKVEDNLREFINNSRYADPLGQFSSGKAYPGDVTRTVPKRDGDATTKYSWIKAPRWDGNAMEVGPLARMVINDMYVVGENAKLIDAGVGTAWTNKYAGVYLNTAKDALDTASGVINVDLKAALDAEGITTNVQHFLMNMVGGLSLMDRLRGRAIESLQMIALLIGLPTIVKGDVAPSISWPTLPTSTTGLVHQLWDAWDGDETHGPAFSVPVAPPAGVVSGYGLIEAPRGALGHFVTSDNGQIVSYQCVVPTTWNGSPKDGVTITNLATGATADGKKHRGAIEQACMSVQFDSSKQVVVKNSGSDLPTLSGVEILRVAHSFDPCIACAVH